MEELARQLEGFQTDAWSIQAVLDVELMTPRVIDPGTGFFVLADAAIQRGHMVTTIDIHQWNPERIPDHICNFLHFFEDLSDATIFMNPPFSLACAFVDHARLLNARKIICFQRSAWREGSRDAGQKRGAWWEANPPARVWLCGDRAQCTRFDLLDGRKLSSPTAHSWYIWERGHRGAEIQRGLYK